MTPINKEEAGQADALIINLLKEKSWTLRNSNNKNLIDEPGQSVQWDNEDKVIKN